MVRASKLGSKIENGDRKGFSGLESVELRNRKPFRRFDAGHVTYQMMASLPGCRFRGLLALSSKESIYLNRLHFQLPL